MRICIYGAGAIGGFLGAYLARAGHDVSLIARGDNLTTLRSRGLTLVHGDTRFTVYPDCTEDPKQIGEVDAVFVAVKGPALPSVGEAITPLLGPTTSVVFAMNGLPWWYDFGRKGPPTSASTLLDPTGSIRRTVGADRAQGCVVDCPTRVSQPGTVVCNSAARGKFTLGEPDGSPSDRVLALACILEAAHISAPVTQDIRQAIWAKLVINLSRSPLAVLTGATELTMAENKVVTQISREMIEEAAAVAAAHGYPIAFDWSRLLDAGHRHNHRPSMLQDWDAQRPMEIDSIVTIVTRFAAEAGLKTPTIDRILALLTLKARQAGLY